jgi:hypothetical protein
VAIYRSFLPTTLSFGTLVETPGGAVAPREKAA